MAELIIAKVVFWLAGVLVVYAYFGYPAVLAILSFFISVTPKRDESYTPKVTLLIMAYNEEGCIREKIENAFATDYPIEVLSFSRIRRLVRQTPRIYLYQRPKVR